MNPSPTQRQIQNFRSRRDHALLLQRVKERRRMQAYSSRISKRNGSKNSSSSGMSSYGSQESKSHVSQAVLSQRTRLKAQKKFSERIKKSNGSNIFHAIRKLMPPPSYYQ